ncbi:MAG: hypothetical protein R3F56_03960 [Planctomycetota bacterium]
MQISRSLSLLLPLALGSTALAQTWTESGDAGKLPGTAQVVALGSGALTQIDGNIDNSSETGGAQDDKDMYMIYITDTATFSATTTGGTTLDTQLFLFSLDGKGVSHNDDDPTTTGLQSRVTGVFVPAPGCYLLAVSTYNRDPQSGGGLIWANSPFNVERQPDGPNAGGAVDSWTSQTTGSTGAYSIFLTGAAYVPQNGVEIYPGVTSFTSRGNISVNAGEVLQGFHGSHWSNLGDNGTDVNLTGLTYITQDQNASTQELYDVVVRGGTDSTGPDATTTGELSVISGLSTPSGGNTPSAWIITADFSTPCAIPENSFFSVGVRFAAAPLWSADGQSIHASANTTQQSGTHQEDHAWQILPGPVVSHPSSFRSWRFALRVNTPVQQNGTFPTGTTTYARGMGGMFPLDTTHGWSTHIRAGAKFASGFAAPFLSTARLPAGLNIAGIDGRLALTGTLVPLPLFNLDATGGVDIPLLDPVPLFGGLSTAYLQSVVVSPTLTDIHFTNSNAVTFQ